MLRLPLREINSRFTTSELFIAAWRSQEQAEAFRKTAKDDHKTQATAQPPTVTQPDGRTVKIAPGQPTGYPPEYYNDEGYFDLSKVTGKQAHAYFKSLGIILPVMRR